MCIFVFQRYPWHNKHCNIAHIHKGQRLKGLWPSHHQKDDMHRDNSSFVSTKANQDLQPAIFHSYIIHQWGWMTRTVSRVSRTPASKGHDKYNAQHWQADRNPGESYRQTNRQDQWSSCIVGSQCKQRPYAFRFLSRQHKQHVGFLFVWSGLARFVRITGFQSARTHNARTWHNMSAVRNIYPDSALLWNIAVYAKRSTMTNKNSAVVVVHANKNGGQLYLSRHILFETE